MSNDLTFVSPSDLPELTEITVGDTLLVFSDGEPKMLNFENFILGPENLTISTQLSAQSTDIATLSTSVDTVSASLRTDIDTVSAFTRTLSARFGYQTLTDANPILWNVSNGFRATVTLDNATASRTLNTPSNILAGDEYTLLVVQPGAGNKQLAFSSDFLFASGINHIDPGANKVSLIRMFYNGTKLYSHILSSFA